MSVLEFNRVTKQYRKRFGGQRKVALDDFSLAINSEEIFGFLGPNGSGKSTAINIAMGLSFATHGSGSILGKPFGDAKVRRRVGFLPENISFYHRSPTSLLKLYGRLNAVPSRELSLRSAEMLQRFGLRSESSSNVRKFSRGMVQRVALAQALINSPELLILDEPTSALDPDGRIVVRETLLEMRKQGKSVFLSSHLISEIEQLCDRIAIIDRGKIVTMGRLTELAGHNADCEITATGKKAQDSMGSSDSAVKERTLIVRVPVEQQRATIEQIWSRGGTIVSVKPVKKTLEDIFLEATAHSRERQSTLDGNS